MNHKTILSLMAIAIVIVVTYPYAINAYHAVQNKPSFKFQNTEVDRIKENGKCTLNISGTLKTNYKGELKEVEILANAEGKLKTYPNKPPEKSKYEIPNTIMKPKSENNFQFYVEVPEKCKYIKSINVTVNRYKKKYF